MQKDHLRPVPASNDGSASEPKSGRARLRPRADKALPTDRLKAHVQVDALKAIAIASHYGKRAVGADDIAAALGVVPTTAGLNNTFFMESGLVTRESKGRYKPTEAVNEFARKHSFDVAAAGRELADTLRQTWYFQAVRQQLDMGKVTKERMVEVLAQAAGATKAHEPQLLALLAWLEYAGLITTEGGGVQLAADAPVETPSLDPPGEESLTTPADPASKGTATAKGRQDPDAQPESQVVLSFDFGFALTASDLQRLEPEQIQAVFEAVGKVMAIKATI